MPSAESADAIVIGGGFYGCAIAHHLKSRLKLARVVLMEREPGLFRRASFHNQARIHNGYHYPRSLTTAFRSRVNLPRFLRDYPDAVFRDFTKLYAIARRNSRVSARQFERFCREIGARLEPASASHESLFEGSLIEAVYAVEEYAFDARALESRAARSLAEAGVEVRLRVAATAVERSPRGIRLHCKGLTPEGEPCAASLEVPWLFNCTYSSLNQLRGAFQGTTTSLKHELTELTLVRLPQSLQDVGITVMDGPFFSCMPFPARSLHSLSHVRYTPHLQWTDEPGRDPTSTMRSHVLKSRFDRMRRDASRYVPELLQAEYVESLVEVKTVLSKTETDDGRPILFEEDRVLPGCYSVLGGKLDNVYDVLDRITATVPHRAMPLAAG